jgi:hypothetical protein
LPVYGVTAGVPCATWAAEGVCLPLGLLEECVAVAGVRERRRRLLPAVAVMVFVIGLCVFSGEGYGEVALKLAGWLPGLAGRAGWRVPGSSALARARRRLGVAPFRELFARLAGVGATQGAEAFGRVLVALDGTRLEVPATPQNVAAFGPPPSGGAFPQVRVVTAAGCGSHGLADAVFGPTRRSEQELARKIARRGRLGAGMLVLADRNFGGYPVVCGLTRTGADVLIRVKSTQWLPPLQMLPDRSWLSVLAEPGSGRAHRVARHRARRYGRPQPGPPDGITVRVIEFSLLVTAAGEPQRTECYRLITTLLDPAVAPAADLAACYARRWEIETSYQEMKIATLGAGQTLRSCHPAGIAQEIWALLCTCQLITAARTSAGLAAGLDPGRISWTITLRALRRAITTMPGDPGAWQAIGAEAASQPLPPRRQRSYPRHTALTTIRRRHKRASHTGAISYQITITQPVPPAHGP